MNNEIFTSSIKTNTATIPFAKFGNGKRKLIILPGLYTKSLIPFAPAVKNQYNRFLKDYTIYFIDRNLSPKEGYNFEKLADDTIFTLKELCLKDCYVLGVSAGGFLAQLITVKSPESVKKLVLGSSSCRANGNSKEFFKEWTELSCQNKLPELGENFSSRVYSPSYFEKYHKPILDAISDTTKEELQTFSIYTKAAMNFDISSLIDKIECPVLVLGAEKDKIFGKEGSLLIEEKINKGKSNCSTFIFENSSHAVYDENPDYLNYVEKFFNS